MKIIPLALVVATSIAAGQSIARAQSTPKPSPYAGVSQPPPDETIVADDSSVAVPAVKVKAPRTVIVSTPAPSPAAEVAAANPDADIVTGSAPQPTAIRTALQSRTSISNPDADIVTFVPNHTGELPEGTNIHMILNQELATGETQSGSDFTGRVSRDVTFSGRVVIPQGSEVVGRVVRVSEGHRFGSPATIRVRPDVVVLPDGSRYVLHAQVIDAGGRSRITDEGAFKPNSHLKKNAIVEGSGVGGGAAVGAVFGGPPGALVGSLVGAGIMTTHLLVQEPSTVKVPKDTALVLSLTEPMSITPAQN